MARSGGDALKIQENSRINSFLQRERLAHRCLNHDSSAPHAAKEDKFGGSETSWISRVPSCPVFTPSIEEFQDPLAYISSIAPRASKYGMCKIVSPLSPSVAAGKVLMKENGGGFKFNTRVQALRLSNWDANDKVTFFTSAQRYTFQEFEKVANKFFARKFSSAAIQPPAFVESVFWRELLVGNSESIEYASDVDGSAFSVDPSDPLASSKWNLKDVSCLPRSTLRLLDSIIPGVTEPMLYIGMLFSMFAWHVEDHYLYSINYHHCGAPKTWYGVPGDACEMFEAFVKEKIYDADMLAERRGAAYDLLIGKTTMFPPSLLLEHNVPVYRAVQAAGEFVITFPRSYHAGFSHGFNCGEAVNFAMADWFPFGAAACRRYSLLNRMPLLPHEELLSKEAALVAKSSLETCALREQSIKGAFLRLMNFQQKVRWLLKRSGATLCISSDTPKNVFCMLCKHMCYISLVTCPCFPEPICLNHAEEMRKCHCGSKRRLLLNKDVKEMDALARSFQPTVQSVAIVQDGMRSEQAFPVLEEDLLDGEDYSSFVPVARMDEEYTVVQFSDIVKDDVKKDTRAADVTDAASSKVVIQKPKPGVAIRTMPEKKAVIVKRSQCVVKDEALHSCFKHKGGIKESCEQFNVVKKEKPSNNRRVRVVRTSYGDSAILVKDIIAELQRSGPVQEVMKTWQADARKQGFILDYSYVDEERVLSYKACHLLKKLLPETEALQLEKLLKGSYFPEGVGPSSSRSSCIDFEENHPGKRKPVDHSDNKPSIKRLKAGSRSPSGSSRAENLGTDTTNNRDRAGRLGASLTRAQENTDAHSRRVLVKNGERVVANAKQQQQQQQDAPRLKIKGPSLPRKGSNDEEKPKAQVKACVSSSQTAVTVGGR